MIFKPEKKEYGLTKREVSILEYVTSKNEKTKSINIEITDSMHSELVDLSMDKGVSKENMFLISIIEEILSQKKMLADKKDLLICDIFDMDRIEEIIDTIEENNIEALIITLKKNAKDFVLTPIERYNSLLS